MHFRSLSQSAPSPSFAPRGRWFRNAATGAEGDAGIESLRGLMILILVAYHAVDVTGVGRAGARYSPYYHFAFTVDSIMMPVFAAIAGFVYAFRPIRRGEESRFLKGKARRLLLPYLAAVTATYFLRHAGSISHLLAAVPGLWRAYLFSYEHFWFLQALFLIFASVCVLERWRLLERRQSWAMVLIIASVLPLVVAGSDFFSLWGAIYLAPFFVLGYGVNRHGEVFGQPTIKIALGVWIGGMAALQLCWLGTLGWDRGRTGPLGILVGLSSCIVLLRLRRAIAPLTVLGIYSYSIYLYHTFGLAAGKRLCSFAHIDSEALLFAVRIVLGIIVGICVHLVAMRVATLRRVLLGLR